MSRIVLHVGTHKTGTTSIQRFLAKNREALKKQGIFYPDFDIVDSDSHYAHLDLPKSIAGNITHRLDGQKLTEFCNEINKIAQHYDITIISAEPFWRARMPGDVFVDQPKKYWALRHEFIERTAQLFPTEMTEVLIVCRGQADFAESIYKETIKTTNLGSSFNGFLKNRWELFCYLEQAEAWHKYFPKITVLPYDTLTHEGSIGESFVKRLGGLVERLSPSAAYNLSLCPDAACLLRALNRHKPTNATKQKVLKSLEEIQNEMASHVSPSRSLWGSFHGRESFEGKFRCANQTLMKRFGQGRDCIKSHPVSPDVVWGDRLSDTFVGYYLNYVNTFTC